MLASSQLSAAKIVYTPADQKLAFGLTSLDLNHNGSTEFLFDYGHSVGAYYLLALPHHKRNGVIGNGQFASALPSGVKVGPGDQFERQYDRMAECTFAGGGTYCEAPWVNVTNRYLGVRFLIKGKTHYGWARLTVTEAAGTGISATLTGYAYETIPNKAIVTGKTKGQDVVTAHPATLGKLALGRR